MSRPPPSSVSLRGAKRRGNLPVYEAAGDCRAWPFPFTSLRVRAHGSQRHQRHPCRSEAPVHAVVASPLLFLSLRARHGRAWQSPGLQTTGRIHNAKGKVQTQKAPRPHFALGILPFPFCTWHAARPGDCFVVRLRRPPRKDMLLRQNPLDITRTFVLISCLLGQVDRGEVRMRLLPVAIQARKWDLAAHVLVLGAIIAREKENSNTRGKKNGRRIQRRSQGR